MHSNCLICQSTQLKKMDRYAQTHLVKCQSCSFVFTQVIPTNEELISFYDGYGRHDYLSPLTVKRYNELLDQFKPFRKTNRILDVGCGIGYFLEVAKERGWEVYGTEFTDKAVGICSEKGINMKQGKLSPADFEPEFFDILTSFEVLEHINNPVEEIQNFEKLLRKGGLVYLTTPNFNSLLRYRLKENYSVITYPEHLAYFTPKTLKNLFLDNGFKKKKIQTTGISVSRLRQGNKKIPFQRANTATSVDENIRTKIEENSGLQFVKKTANKMLTIFGVGDSLKGWFIKK